jgi:hypothetical protein
LCIGAQVDDGEEGDEEGEEDGPSQNEYIAQVNNKHLEPN